MSDGDGEDFKEDEDSMGASKIVDEQEVIRWFEEGRTYQWMVDTYLEKYNIETVPSLWGNFRRRRGLTRRITRDDELIPWHVQERHRWAYPVAMLRVEARKRAGLELREQDKARLESWRAMLDEQNVVVHYDPESKEGFSYVPRTKRDTDIIRRPSHKTTLRPAAD
jgi:hypothetical protein